MRSPAPCCTLRCCPLFGHLRSSPVRPVAAHSNSATHRVHSVLYIRILHGTGYVLSIVHHHCRRKGAQYKGRSSPGTDTQDPRVQRESDPSSFRGGGCGRRVHYRDGSVLHLIKLIQRAAILLQDIQQEPFPQLSGGQVVPRGSPEEDATVPPHNAIVVICTPPALSFQLILSRNIKWVRDTHASFPHAGQARPSSYQ